MATVKRRIEQYNREFGQPRGGLLPLKSFEATQLEDQLGALDGALENRRADIIGSAVDYLLRLSQVRPQNTDEAKLSASREVFLVSLRGALNISTHTSYKSANIDASILLEELEARSNGDGKAAFVIDHDAVRIACQLASYDVGYRAGALLYNVESSNQAPDSTTTSHVLAMVERAQKYFEKHGSITKAGFEFSDSEGNGDSSQSGYTTLVNAGDGDFLTTDTLWELKTNKTKPTKDHTLQVLMYFLMGKESGRPEFRPLSRIGILNPRLGTAYQIAVRDIPADVIKTVRRDVIGYED